MVEATRKVHFVSLGCPKNLVDSEIMVKKLVMAGYELTEDPRAAETYVVNTCSFIESAKEESLEKIFELTEYKEKFPERRILVTGCLVQRYGRELMDELPEADALIGSGEFQNIHKILENLRQGVTRRDYFHLPTFLQDEATERLNSQPGHRAYLKISEGCKKRCSFCAIPRIRGNLQSRTLKAILSEAKLLSAGGVKELNIVSHDFTDFGWDLKRKSPEAKESPTELLRALSQVDGVEWVRLLYLYPDGITDEMIDLIKNSSRLVNYFDMPLQHASDSVLARMNRKMTRTLIQDRIDKIREEIPEAVLRTQFIVGFPGETEEDFEILIDFIKYNKFDRMGCFSYSQEESTVAGRMHNQVPETVKRERYEKVMELGQEISRACNQRIVGKVVDVLVEGVSDETDLLLQGRMPEQAPEVDGVVYINEGNAKVGEIVRVKITEAMDYDLLGQIVTE